MTSKEALENIFMEDGTILYYDDDGNPQYLDTIDEYKAIKQDLEKLEQYEAIFKEPLKDIRERLEVLEILKKHLNYSEAKDLDTSAISKENYNITIFKSLYKEDFNKIKQWLEADKNG